MTPQDHTIRTGASGEVVLRGTLARANPARPWRELWLGFIDRNGSEETCVDRDATSAFQREQTLCETLANIRSKVRFLKPANDALASSLSEIEQTINAVLDP